MKLIHMYQDTPTGWISFMYGKWIYGITASGKLRGRNIRSIPMHYKPMEHKHETNSYEQYD